MTSLRSKLGARSCGGRPIARWRLVAVVIWLAMASAGVVVAGIIECGNNIVEGVEQCDDGNTFGGDGCASNCSYEVFAELTFDRFRDGVSVPDYPRALFNGQIAIASGNGSAVGQNPGPYVVRAFSTDPVVVPQIGVFCIRGVEPEGEENPLGPGNISIGLLGEVGQSVNILSVSMRTQEWVNPLADPGGDERHCSADDPGLSAALFLSRNLRLSLRIGCPGDTDHDGAVTVDDLVQGTRHAINGCPLIGIP